MSPGMESATRPFAAEVLRRLPLAEAFYTVWGHIAADAVLDDLFDRHRGRCFQDQLPFAELVRGLADALTRDHGRGRGAILDAVHRNQISCQVRAVYGKLARLPLPLAEAFFTTLTQRLRPLFPATARPAALPASLDALSVVVIDGKKVKRVAKRLLPTRNQPGKLYGGKRLVAYLSAEGVAVALAADVEANDIRSVGPVANRPRGRGRATAVGGRPPVLRSDPAPPVCRRRGPLRRPVRPEHQLPRGCRFAPPTSRRYASWTRAVASRVWPGTSADTRAAASFRNSSYPSGGRAAAACGSPARAASSRRVRSDMGGSVPILPHRVKRKCDVHQPRRRTGTLDRLERLAPPEQRSSPGSLPGVGDRPLHLGFGRWYTTWPPSTVYSTFTSRSSATGHVRRSRSVTIRSANFPASRLPFSFSSWCR